MDENQTTMSGVDGAALLEWARTQPRPASDFPPLSGADLLALVRQEAARNHRAGVEARALLVRAGALKGTPKLCR